MRHALITTVFMLTACAGTPSWAPTLGQGVLDAISCGLTLADAQLAGTDPDAKDYLAASRCWLDRTASGLGSTAAGPKPSVEHGEAVLEAAVAQREYEARPSRRRARLLTEAVERCEAAASE